MELLGVDVGGSGIKAAVVDIDRGALAGERVRVATPQPATPSAVADATADLVRDIAPGAPAGIGVPAVVCDGTTLTAANVDQAWLGAPAERIFSQALGRACALVNDADAAGLAEMRFGAGRDERGVVLMLTLGTGIGSALFVDGTLVPNTELGHLELDGEEAEARASAAARDREGLSWGRWARRLDAYLRHVEVLFWPDLVIIGGGVSKKPEKFMPLLTPRRARIAAASMGNAAGVVGAALVAAERGLTAPARGTRPGRVTAVGG
jgi:polyphosphate glucokinase